MATPVQARPRLSIIVTSYTLDRLQDLQELLDSLHSQSYRDTEVIFVGEKDRELCSKVKAYAQSRDMPNLRVVFNDGTPGCSAARDVGISHARAEIVAFIDDDALAPPDWAEQIVRSFSDRSIIALTGPAQPLWVHEQMSWFPEELYWIIGCTGWAEVDGVRDVRNVWGMNMAFRREAFALAGCFSQDMGAVQGKRLHGEEVDLSLRVRKETGQRIVYNPQVKVMHKAHGRRLSAKWISKTSYWTGYTRHALKGLSKRYGVEEDFLSVERRLLGRILKGLLPRTLVALFLRPRRSLITLWIVVMALAFVAAGYLSHTLSNLAAYVRLSPGREVTSRS
ncbi:MAG: glycosyltransferase family 2 protein [Dehalococcoidia bacterium]